MTNSNTIHSTLFLEQLDKIINNLDRLMKYLKEIENQPIISDETQPLSYRDNFAIAAEIASNTLLLGIAINVILGLSLAALMTFSLLFISVSKAAEGAPQAEIPLALMNSVLGYMLFAFAINCAAPIGAGLGAFVHNLTLNNPYRLVERLPNENEISTKLNAVEKILNAVIEQFPYNKNISTTIKGNISTLKSLLKSNPESTENSLLIENNQTRQTSLIAKLSRTTQLFQ